MGIISSHDALVDLNKTYNAKTVIPTDISKTVASTATPEAIAATQTLVQSVTLIGNNAAQTANTSTAYLGSATAQDIPIAPGENIELSAPQGKTLNLAQWFLNVGTNGDGVRGLYVI